MAEKKTVRGEETRKRLLDAARQLFSEHGFAGVSTRDITRLGQATLPAIPHHFGSKEGLYQAVLLELADQMNGGLAAASAQARRVLAQAEAPRPALLVALEQLISAYALAVLQSQPAFARLMVQEQARPTAASAAVNQTLDTHLMEPLRDLIARLRHLPPGHPEATLQAFLLVGRVLIFRTANSAVLRLLGWSELGPAQLTDIVQLICAEVRSLFSQEPPKPRSKR